MAELEVKYPNVKVQLSGEDGNVFVIIGRVKLALHRANVDPKEVDMFLDECTSGDYDHVLQTCMKWVDVY